MIFYTFEKKTYLPQQSFTNQDLVIDPVYTQAPRCSPSTPCCSCQSHSSGWSDWLAAVQTRATRESRGRAQPLWVLTK